MTTDREEGIIARALPPGKAGKPSRVLVSSIPRVTRLQEGRKGNPMKRTATVLGLCAMFSLGLLSAGCAGFFADNPDLELAADIAIEYLANAEPEALADACGTATNISQEIHGGLDDITEVLAELDVAIGQYCTE